MISSLGLSCTESSPVGSKVSPRGAIGVSIDFEGGTELAAAVNNIDEVNTEFGVSVLDPLELQDEMFNEHRVKSFNFVSGSPRYIRRASAKFLFGETTICRPGNFLDALFALLPTDRSIVLVVHTVYTERATLKRLGFGMDHPRIAGVVDIWPLSGDVFHTSRGLGSLQQIMTELGISWKEGSLHCAGNDAYYTMQSALLLAARGYQEQCPCPGRMDLKILGALYQAATADTPSPRRPEFPSEKARELLRAGPEARQARESFKAEICRCEAEIEGESFAELFRLEEQA